MFNEFITSEENIFSVQQLSICISICISCPLKVLRFNTGILHDSCEVPLTKTLNGVLSIAILCLILYLLSACNDFLFGVFVTMI